MKKGILVVLLLAVLIFTGCTQDSLAPDNEESGETLPPNPPTQELVKEEETPEDIDLEEVRPNELGQIMVLMYHQIGPIEREWIRTPDNFRKDLQALYDNGYRLVSLKDVLRGEINVEAGYSPVVITFDDGTEGQFRYMKKDGEWIIDPDSAVGILMEMNEKNPGFGTAATFYVNTNPFRQPEHTQKKLQKLLELGMDIGNHTLNHPNLGHITSAEEMQKQMGGLVKEIQRYLPGYEINSLALPFGAHPKEEFYPHAIKGEYQGTLYHNVGILLVGSHPSQSPFHKDFNPLKIPRIRGEDPFEYGYLYFWMDFFDRNPQLRYISDGNPNFITFPKELLEKINLDALEGKEMRTY